MKRTSIVIVLLLLLFAGTAAVTYAATEHYKQTKSNEPAPEATITVDEANRQRTTALNIEAAKYQKLLNSFNEINLQCQKGQAAYDKLTPYNKTQTERPDCAAAAQTAF